MDLLSYDLLSHYYVALTTQNPSYYFDISLEYWELLVLVDENHQQKYVVLYNSNKNSFV